MPLTFAHPAAVLPFKFLPRKYYSWTGLIVGAVVPDFEAFIKLGGFKTFSHSWVGMFAFDLPVGVALCLLFHLVVRDALLQQLPASVAGRLWHIRGIDWLQSFRRRFVIVIASLLIGIFTHLVWDRLTHTDTYTYHELAGLNMAPDAETTLRQWLQWSSSVAGALLLGYQFSILPVQPIVRRPWSNFWYLVAGTASVLMAIRIHFYSFGDDLINSAIGGLMLGVLLSSLVVKFRDAKIVR